MPDPCEPERIIKAISEMGLNYVVITCVTRDDLPDGGASHFSVILEAIHSHNPRVKVEVLISDLQGSFTALQTIVSAAPEVLNHNVETVPSLYYQVRPQADYERSLKILWCAKKLSPNLLTKSGLMVGLGETKDDLIKVMSDLREVDCDFLTIGQYLRPSNRHHPVARYLTQEEFEEYREAGYRLGFKYVASGPLVRSSYNAMYMYELGVKAAFYRPGTAWD
jgi:lipoic acid synthetase